MSTEQTKTRGMCIATRCTSVEQFIQMFHRFVDEESFFVSTLNTRPPGLETSFSVQLADGTPVLRGLCVVLQAWTTPANPFKTPGVRLGIKRLTANSMVVFEQLLVTRNAKVPPTIPAPRPLATVVVAKPGTPKPIEKSRFTETAPARSVPSRVVLEQPARAASEPIPQHVPPESTDVTDEKTNVRETSPLGAPPKPVAAKPGIDLAKTLASIGKPPAANPTADAVKAAHPTKPALDKPSPTALGTGKLAVERAASGDAAPASVPELAKPVPTADPMADAVRTPGSDLVLPANPLMNLTDESLEGYVDCTLYEETGNFFPADDDTSFVDDVVPPPGVRAAIRFDSSPTMEIGAPRFDSQPDGSVARRDSSPALVMPAAPPAAPRESVTVDPALIARGSTPGLPSDGAKQPADASAAVEPDASPVSKLPLAPPRFDSPALGVAAAVLAPTPRKLPPWWLLGSVGGLAVAVTILIVVVMTSKSDGGTRAPAPVVTKPVAQVAPPIEPPKPEPMAEAPPDDDEPEEEPEEAPHDEGAPIVGSGPCKVVVHSTPAGSMVRLNGNKLGPSPITVAAPCGKHKLDIMHPRYATQSRLVTLTEDKEETLEVTLSRPTHVVTVTSSPPGAQIFINGRSAGITPTKLNVLGFVTLKLELKKTGYQPAKTKLYSKVAQDKVSVRLTRW